MKPIDFLIIVGIIISSICTFLSSKYQKVAINLVSGIVILFTHGCYFASKNFASAFGGGSESEWTNSLLLMALIILAIGIFLGRSNSETSESNEHKSKSG